MPGPESTSPIRLDESKALIVIYCTDHDWYKASRFHRDEAYDAACDHEEREHPGDVRQRNARTHRNGYRRVAATDPRLSSAPGSRV